MFLVAWKTLTAWMDFIAIRTTITARISMNVIFLMEKLMDIFIVAEMLTVLTKTNTMTVIAKLVIKVLLLMKVVQILMNVLHQQTIVIQSRKCVSTQLEALFVCVKMDIPVWRGIVLM